MANDHYVICETKCKYCYLGEFYEGDVGSGEEVAKRMESDTHRDRLNNGVGVMYMLRLCAFMRRHRPHGVRVVDENEFWDILDANTGIDKTTKWTEDEL